MVGTVHMGVVFEFKCNYVSGEDYLLKSVYSNWILKIIIYSSISYQKPVHAPSLNSWGPFSFIDLYIGVIDLQ